MNHVLLILSSVLVSPEVDSPALALGLDPCAEGAIVDSSQAAAYLKHAASRSDRVHLETIGLSTEGRPILCAVVSAPENLRRLEEIREKRGKVFALVTCGVHPAEVGSTPASLLLLHRLVTERSPRAREVLSEVVVLVIPCFNPDGTDRVSGWLRGGRKDGGEEARGALPFPQHRFAGHDLNRDWMLGTQSETRAVIEQVHNRFRPWITIDLHQMGSSGPRVFVPPYADPADPTIPPELLRQVDRLGNRVLDALTKGGRRGAARRWTYDAWTPARAYPFYHGGLRFLVEAASGRFSESIEVAEQGLRVFGGNNDASADHPAPWRGGRWGLPEATDSLVAAAELTLEGLLDEPLRSGQKTHLALLGPAESVRLDDADADPAVVAELVRALELGGARAYRDADADAEAGGWIVSDPAWGRGWCRALLLCSRYPEVRGATGGSHVPYDTTSHDLAHLSGVRSSVVRKEGEPRSLRSPRSPRVALREPRPPTGHRLASQSSLAFFSELPDLLDRGIRIQRLTLSGDFVLDGPLPAPSGEVPAIPFEYPSIVVLAGEGAASDEGWLRWVLEEHRFRFRSVGVDSIEPSVPGSRPRRVVIVPEGVPLSLPGRVDKLRTIANAGGRVIALGKASRDLARVARLPVEEAAVEPASLPGVILQTVFARTGPTDPILWGCPSPPAVFCAGGPLWKAPGDATGASPSRVEPIVVIDREAPLACGLLPGSSASAVGGSVPLLRVKEGDQGGEWILFGCSPHYRAWTLGTFRLLFNAILAP